MTALFLQKLTSYRRAIQEIPTFGLQFLIIAPELLDSAAAGSQSTGLLTNDALIVAVEQATGLTKIASNDSDFDRVPGVSRYAPV